jgi:hypothetical protein
MRVISAISFGIAGRRLPPGSSRNAEHCHYPVRLRGQIRAVPTVSPGPSPTVCCRSGGVRRCRRLGGHDPRITHRVSAHVIIERLAEAADTFADSITIGG